MMKNPCVFEVIEKMIFVEKKCDGWNQLGTSRQADNFRNPDRMSGCLFEQFILLKRISTEIRGRQHAATFHDAQLYKFEIFNEGIPGKRRG